MPKGRLKNIAADVKLALRVSGDVYDAEVAMLVDAAVEDMERVGINPYYIEDANPMVKLAICTFAKARFGFDNPEAERLEASYRQMLVDMLHSDANAATGSYR